MGSFKYICFLIQLLLVISCTTYRNKRIGHDPPDYSDTYYWAALPSMKDSADIVPKNSGLKDEQEHAKADVFFIHPTTHVGRKEWNSNLHDTASRNKTSRLCCRYEASAFNNCCRVYVPHYRTAKILTYFVSKKKKQKVFDVAYGDVKAAFLYYLRHYNNGRPFIIAAHSQGAEHAIRLCKEFFDKDSVLSKKLIAAYIPGAIVFKDTYTFFKPCEDSSETGCYLTWNSVPYGSLFFLGKPIKNAVCVNPLTWKINKEHAPADLNKGGLPFSFDRIDVHIADAQISPHGLLWIHKPHYSSLDYPKINSRSYHFLDFSLFYMNIRENAKQRIDAYFSRIK